MTIQEVRAAINDLRIHAISGYEWDCDECHYHNVGYKCSLSGIVSMTSGEFDSDERKCDHEALLDRAAVLALLDTLA